MLYLLVDHSFFRVIYPHCHAVKLINYFVYIRQTDHAYVLSFNTVQTLNVSVVKICVEHIFYGDEGYYDITFGLLFQLFDQLFMTLAVYQSVPAISAVGVYTNSAFVGSLLALIVFYVIVEVYSFIFSGTMLVFPGAAVSIIFLQWGQSLA